jgi:hypothetical protein
VEPQVALKNQFELAAAAGSKNRHPAIRYDVGKTVKRDEPKRKSHRQQG